MPLLVAVIARMEERLHTDQIGFLGRGTMEPSSQPARGELLFKDLTYEIIGAFYAVYNALGYGFLESVYRNALVVELGRRGLKVSQEVSTEVHYLGCIVGLYRMDLVVEGKILIEVKASAVLSQSDRRQLFNYLRASKLAVGLLLHFGPKPVHHRLISPIFTVDRAVSE